ncbi:hypothetical protein PO124_12895 [Bacillus licheniformis]|nr:hypothetical protein [Bacillus licheniformis]
MEKVAENWPTCGMKSIRTGVHPPFPPPETALGLHLSQSVFHVSAAEIVAVDPNASDHLPLKGSITY